MNSRKLIKSTYVNVRLVEVEEAVVGGGLPCPECEEDPE
jgi:hypothetical protein